MKDLWDVNRRLVELHLLATERLARMAELHQEQVAEDRERDAITLLTRGVNGVFHHECKGKHYSILYDSPADVEVEELQSDFGRSLPEPKPLPGEPGGACCTDCCGDCNHLTDIDVDELAMQNAVRDSVTGNLKIEGGPETWPAWTDEDRWTTDDPLDFPPKVRHGSNGVHLGEVS